MLWQSITFEFIDKPYLKDINLIKMLSTTQTIDQITRKQNHLKFLKEELPYKRI